MFRIETRVGERVLELQMVLVSVITKGHLLGTSGWGND